MKSCVLNQDEEVLRSQIAALVEEELLSYPEYPYQQAFTPFGLREQLIDYIISHMRVQSALLEEIWSTALHKGLPSLPPELRFQIKNLIGRGIYKILELYSSNFCYAEQMVL